MDRISRGWALAKQSWAVLKNDRSLVFSPILSAVFAVLAAVAIWTPALLWQGLTGTAADAADDTSPALLAAAVATAYISTFIAIFFNVALAACAARSLRGEDTKVSEGISAAMSRLGPILGWTLLATTVGLILRAVEDRLPPAVRGIVSALTGAAWAIATYFVVPVLALEGGGPVRSLQRSAQIVKARWGESATGAAAISVLTFLLAGAIIVVGGFLGGELVTIGQPLPAVIILLVTGAAVIVVSVISAALSQIFRVAVYQYAATGRAPGQFDPQLLQAAFVPR